MSEPCTLCGMACTVPGEPRPTAIVTAAKDFLGEMIMTPGIYPVCPRCRQQVAVAERAATPHITKK